MGDRALVLLVLVGVGVGGAWYVSRRRDEAAGAHALPAPPMTAAESVAPQALPADMHFGGGIGGELIPATGFEAGGLGSVQFAELEPEPEAELTARGNVPGKVGPKVAKPGHMRPKPQRGPDGQYQMSDSRLLECYKCCGNSSKCRKSCEFIAENGDHGNPSAGPARKCWEQANASRR